MIIERFATYAGGDPRRAPAVLALAGYAEHAFGAWHPRGGVHELVRALVRRLEALGGELRLGTPVERVLSSHGRACGVAIGAGAVAADAVVINADPSLLGLRGRTPGLVHHSITFPADYDAEFDDVFARRRPPADPTVYVSAPVATDPSDAPAGQEAWFVLVNAPAIGDGADWDGCEERLIDRLGVRDRIEARARRTPGDLDRE